MLKTIFVTGALVAALHGRAHAACSSEDAMNKASGVSEALSSKVETKPDDASKIMTDLGTIMGTGTVTEQTCVKLDALMERARKL